MRLPDLVVRIERIRQIPDVHADEEHAVDVVEVDERHLRLSLSLSLPLRRGNEDAPELAAQTLSAEVIVGADGEARVQVEAVTRDGLVSERTGGLGGAVALARVVLDVPDGADCNA